jgi:hypothetical protein
MKLSIMININNQLEQNYFMKSVTAFKSFVWLIILLVYWWNYMILSFLYLFPLSRWNAAIWIFCKIDVYLLSHPIKLCICRHFFNKQSYFLWQNNLCLYRITPFPFLCRLTELFSQRNHADFNDMEMIELNTIKQSLLKGIYAYTFVCLLWPPHSQIETRILLRA